MQTPDDIARAPTERPPALDQEQDADSWVGRVLDDRYRVTEKLGEGGMGAVYVAEHLKLKKLVAIKAIHEDLLSNEEVRKRFEREAMAAAHLEHPHIAGASDCGTLPEGGTYLVMQLVRGRNLIEVEKEHGRIPWPVACEIGAQVADAMSAAHAAGIVHRDLKPDNVMVEPRGEGQWLVKVLDFGIARVMLDDAPGDDATARALTRLGTVMGTPGYMAPEQAMGEKVDARADIYALGAILWEMIAGRPLYETNDLTAIVTRQLTQPPPDPGAVAGDPTVPPALVELTARMLSARPDDRPARAADVRDALRRLALETRPSITESTGVQRVQHALGTPIAQLAAALPRTFAEVASAGTEAVRTVAGRRPLVAVGAVCAAILVVGTAIWVVSGFFGDDAPDEEAVAPAIDPEPAVDPVRPNKRARKQRRVRERPAEVAPAPPPSTGPFAAEIDQILSGRRNERVAAARALLAHRPADEVPPFALAIASLEMANNCRDRETAIARIVALGDRRALPALQRIADTPRRNCGFFNARDCYACIRDEVDAAIAALR